MALPFDNGVTVVAVIVASHSYEWLREHRLSRQYRFQFLNVYISHPTPPHLRLFMNVPVDELLRFGEDLLMLHRRLQEKISMFKLTALTKPFKQNKPPPCNILRNNYNRVYFNWDSKITSPPPTSVHPAA